MPDGVLLQCVAEPPLLQVFLIFMWAYNTTPPAGMSSFFFKTRISGLKTGFGLVGVMFFTADHAENTEIVVIPEQRRDSLRRFLLEIS
jgi:hypothetical protein